MARGRRGGDGAAAAARGGGGGGVLALRARQQLAGESPFLSLSRAHARVRSHAPPAPRPRRTRDKINGLIRKWQTLIEASADVKTTDGYSLRLFCIGFTKRRPNQIKKTSYAKASQIRAIRKKMVEIMEAEASKSDLKELVKKFIPEAIGRDIEKACQGIYPLQTVFIRKVKTLKQPRFDLIKLMEMHGDAAGEDAGKVLAAAPMVEALEGAGGRL